MFSKNKSIFTIIQKEWQLTDFFSLLIAASLSLTTFYRLLQFFKTPNLDKPIVLTALLVYFSLLTIFFGTPILQFLFFQTKRQVTVFLTFIAVLFISLLFLFLPYRIVPFRTLHTIDWYVPTDSSPMVIERLLGPDDKTIPPNEVHPDAAANNDKIVIQPGETLSYSREMTGGLTFQLAAVNGEATLVTSWDGQTQTIFLEKGQTQSVHTNPLSWGQPSTLNRVIMFVFIANEWLSYVFMCVLFGGFLLMCYKQKGTAFPVHIPVVKRYMADVLVLFTILISLAILESFFPFARQTFNLFLLAPGLIYFLLKLFFFSFIYLLPLIILFIGVILNPFIPLKLPYMHRLQVLHLDDPSLNQLAIEVWLNPSTMLSIGFFRELRNSVMVIPKGTLLADQNTIERLKQINILEELHVIEYEYHLSYTKWGSFLKIPDWRTWKGLDGNFYFYDSGDPIISPIVTFQYANDLYFVPLQHTQELGLFNDFILD